MRLRSRWERGSWWGEGVQVRERGPVWKPEAQEGPGMEGNTSGNSGVGELMKDGDGEA